MVKRLLRQRTFTDLQFLAGQKQIARLPHRQCVGVTLRGLAACIQVVPFVKELLQCTLPVIPRPEVMELAIDLFGPTFGGVGEQRKVGIRLRWFLCSRHCRSGVPRVSLLVSDVIALARIHYKTRPTTPCKWRTPGPALTVLSRGAASASGRRPLTIRAARLRGSQRVAKRPGTPTNGQQRCVAASGTRCFGGDLPPALRSRKFLAQVVDCRQEAL